MLMVLLSLAVIIAVFKIAARFFAEESISSRNIIAQRITREIEENFLQTDDVINSEKSVDVDAVIKKVFLDRREEWQASYGRQSCPDEVKIILFSSNENQGLRQKAEESFPAFILIMNLRAWWNMFFHKRKMKS